MAFRRSLAALLLFAASAQAAPSAADAPLLERDVAEPAAAGVTPENILANERFWPYQVALVTPWKPPGRGSALEPDQLGVLIRVETSKRARIDFGRDGVHEIPIVETDLVARTERVRRGELEKVAPNFVWAIGARLLDSTSPVLVPLSLQRVAAHRAFLCVFADPRAEGFPVLARALAPLRERDGVATILFPQGDHPDAQVLERLRALGWTIPFVHDHLSESYARSLLEDGTPTPYVLLQTDEGRLLFQRSFDAATLAELERVIDATFADRAVTPGSAARDPAATSPH